MIIRPAQLLDIEKLSPLYAELGYPVKEAELVRRLKTVLSHPDYHLLVAVDDNEIIGMIGYAKMLFLKMKVPTIVFLFWQYYKTIAVRVLRQP